MAGRYLVTGVQLGMLKALFQTVDKELIANKEGILIIDEILEKQFVGNSFNTIEQDVKIIGEWVRG